MTDAPQITGNGVTFADERDLTDTTRLVLLDVLVDEFSRVEITAEGMKAAARAIARVEWIAAANGWTPRATAHLGVVAGDLYGRILADVALTTASTHRAPADPLEPDAPDLVGTLLVTARSGTRYLVQAVKRGGLVHVELDSTIVAEMMADRKVNAAALGEWLDDAGFAL